MPAGQAVSEDATFVAGVGAAGGVSPAGAFAIGASTRRTGAPHCAGGRLESGDAFLQSSGSPSRFFVCLPLCEPALVPTPNTSAAARTFAWLPLSIAKAPTVAPL